MALKGSETALAAALQAQMKNASTYEEAWQKFAEILIDHLTENAVVIGEVPSGGGPITEGKLQ
jgi:hypothetical protein